MDAAEQLCLACGLCCDGALFGHVRLAAVDNAKNLKALGLPVAVSRGQPPITHLPQPCAALCTDRTCRIYADRPRQCRAFECGVFKEARAGRIPFAVALRRVRRARRLADKIRGLLRQLGDTHEHRALSERFERMQRRLEAGGADAAAADAFAELSVAMHAFHRLTHEKFHTQPDAAR